MTNKAVIFFPTTMLLKNNDHLCFLVCDLQPRIGARIAGIDAVVANATKLLNAAKLCGRTAIVTEQYPSGLGSSYPAILEACKSTTDNGGVCVVSKVTFSMLGGGGSIDLDLFNQFVLCGLETHICVLQTALELRERGKAVFIATDSTASGGDARQYDDAIATLRQAGCVALTTEALLFQLISGKEDPLFKGIQRLVKDA